MQGTRLSAQTFSSSTLNRSILERRDADFLERILPHAHVLLVAGTQCCVEVGTTGVALKWHTTDGLEGLGLEHKHGLLYNKRSQTGELAIVPFLLGQEGSGSLWRLAADVSTVLTHLPGLEFRQLRSLLSSLPMAEVAAAGHAVALSQWHASNAFCSQCGAPNKQVEAGSKVQCTVQERHRLYPRTDPVAIMIVEDRTGGRALLGRPQKLRTGVLTCLSGFIEQGESIEEAVRREVFEEAGVRVGEVAILGSQPWPIGRGGGCELMVGCVGQALGDELAVDADEMADVRWVSKSDVRAAVEASKRNNDFDGQTSTADGLDFFVPPTWAIAHHLISTWAARDQAWFSKL